MSQGEKEIPPEVGENQRVERCSDPPVSPNVNKFVTALRLPFFRASLIDKILFRFQL